MPTTKNAAQLLEQLSGEDQKIPVRGTGSMLQATMPNPVESRTDSAEVPAHVAWGWRARRVYTEYGAPIDTPIPDIEVFLEQSIGPAIQTIWIEQTGGWSYDMYVSDLWRMADKLRDIAKSLAATEVAS